MKTRLVAGLLAMALCCTFYSGMCTGKEDSVGRAAGVMIKNNIKLVRSFVQYFDNATHQYWDTLGRNYLVKFTISTRQGRALFSKDGHLIYSILFGTEKELPEDVRYEVRSNYFDYRITKVSEIKQKGRTIWVVNMVEGEKHLTVRIEDGEMEEVQRFTED